VQGKSQKKRAGILHTLSRTPLKEGLAGSRGDAFGIDYEKRADTHAFVKAAEKIVRAVCPGLDLPALPVSPN